MQHEITLIKLRLNNSLEWISVTPQDCNDPNGVHCWKDNNETIQVSLEEIGLIVRTGKGTYTLQKHPNQNYFWGKLNGHKAHVILKPMSGKVIYWA